MRGCAPATIISSTRAGADDGRDDSGRVCAVGATLGEGPVWVRATRLVVRRHQGSIASTASIPRPARMRSWDAPRAGRLGAAGAAAAADRGGLKSGLAPVRSGERRRSRCSHRRPSRSAGQPAERRHGRLPTGALWFGSMDDGETLATGRLYRLAGGAARDTGLPPVVDHQRPRDLARRPHALPHRHAGRDDLARRRSTTTARSGTPSLFVRIEDGAGYPDGPTVDAEGLPVDRAVRRLGACAATRPTGG